MYQSLSLSGRALSRQLSLIVQHLMTLEELYEAREEYKRDPDLKQRLGDWYVKTVEERIAEEEAKLEEPSDPVREDRYRKWVLRGRILDPEYVAEHGLTLEYDMEEAMSAGMFVD